MKRFGALCFVLLVAGSCVFKNSPGETGNLISYAKKADNLTYEALYNFSITGQLAGGVSARLQIAQIPPTVLHRLDTTTKLPGGGTTTVSSWFISNPSGHFACAQYGGSTKCTEDSLATTGFGDDQVDGFFDLPRSETGLAQVRKTTRPARIRGEKGTCFEGSPVEPSEPPVTSPQPTIPTDSYRYELCYSDDGILLRGRRTNLTDLQNGGAAQDYVLEVVSITRVVQPSDVHLPGPIVSPDVLKP